MPRLKSLVIVTRLIVRILILDQLETCVNLAGIELRYLVNEIKKLSEGYYVSNIYGITKSSLLLKLHHPQKSDIFLMLTTTGMWITNKKIDQVETNRLLKRLRNDLLRAKIVDIKQLNAERVIYLKFNNFDKEFILVAEFFGDGNLILCNADMKILALLHSIDVRHRKLGVGLQYIPPPNNSLDIFQIKSEQFNQIVKNEVEAVRWIGKNLGLPKKYAEEIFHRTGINPKKYSNSLSQNEINELYNNTNDLVNKIIQGEHKTIIIKKDDKTEIYPIEIVTDEKFEPVKSFMEGLDKIFTEDIINSGKDIQTSATSKKIKELQVQLDEQTKAVDTVLRRSSQISSVAKAIMGFATMGILSMEDDRIESLLKENNAELVNIKGIPYVKVLDEKIEINLKSSMQATASVLFNESKKQANAVSTIEEQKKRTQKKIEKLKNKSKNEEESIGFKEIAKRTWFQRYRWFFTSDGLIAIGGRDSSSNSAVIRKHLEKNDKVFHAEIFGSPFFIIKNASNASSSSLNEVAHATVCFSRAWREAMYGMSAYWVSPEQIKKAAPSGQFLPKGSFIVDGQRNFVKIASLKMAVGILSYNDDSYLLVCGPPEPIKKQCLCYAIIEPSSGDMVDAAKKIKFEFTKVHEEITKTIPLDEFVRVLPAGGSHITELGDGENTSIT